MTRKVGQRTPPSTKWDGKHVAADNTIMKNAGREAHAKAVTLVQVSLQASLID